MLLQDAAALDTEHLSPHFASHQQDSEAAQSTGHYSDQHMAMPTDNDQSPGAVMEAQLLPMSRSPHVTLEEPIVQAATAQHQWPLAPAPLPHNSETTALHLDAAAEVRQSAAFLSQATTEQPMAGTFDVDAELPGTIATHASIVAPFPCFNGHVGTWDQPYSSGLDGLVALAQPNHQEPRGPELEVSGTQQPKTGSYGWHAEDGCDDRQQECDLNYSGLDVVRCSREQEPAQSCSTTDNGQEPPSFDEPSQDASLPQYIAANIANPSQIQFRSAKPPSLGQKRQLYGDGHNDTDSIVDKKQCLALSGPTY